MIRIRRFAAHDAEAYLALRLRALRDHPDAYLVSAEEEEARGLEDIRDWIAKLAASDDDLLFGAFEDDRPIGIAGVCRLVRSHAKGRHKALLWGVYVAPEARGRKIGRQLIEHAIEATRRVDGIEAIQLGVGVDNEPARRLYESVGFRTFGTEPCSMRVDGRRVDEHWMILFLVDA
ncbi:MAG: GNAT family N-acetyltransferase [Planctomycetota bacterium]